MPDQEKGGTPFSRGGNENGDQQQLKAVVTTPAEEKGGTPFSRGGNENGDQQQLKAVVTTPAEEKGGTPFSRGGNENGDQQELKATPRFGRGGHPLRRRHTIRGSKKPSSVMTASLPTTELTIIEDAQYIGGDVCVDDKIHHLQLGAHVLFHTVDLLSLLYR